MADISLQWNLDRTLDRNLSLAIDFVRIAHNDNVQPIALMACERFGATLPICRQTRSLVETECKKEEGNLVLESIKAMIIPAGGQVIERLTTNIAGLNFLALAASLISVATIVQSADALQRMIESSATDKLVVPPDHHVRSLLEVLEPRLNRVGFLDRCYTTERFLRDTLGNYGGNGNEIPTSSGIGSVVSALRNLARVGNEDIDNVVFTPHTCFAWLLTFVEWCLGVSPAIYLSDGSTVSPQPESKVIIRIPISPKSMDGIMIESFTTSGTLYDSVRIQQAEDEYGKPVVFSGMVTLNTHAEQFLQSIQADSGLGLRAIMEALSYAIPEATSLIIPNISTGDSVERHSIRAKFFPNQSRIHKAALAYLGPYAKNFRGMQELPFGSNDKLLLLLPISKTMK